MPFDSQPSPEAIHPSLWRTSQLARSHTRVVDCGHPVSSAQLPGGDWPISSLNEELVSQAGCGELRLLKPVLSAAGKRRVAMIAPPHVPNALALASMGLSPSQVVWVQPDRAADALWAAECVLRSGGFFSVYFRGSWVEMLCSRGLSKAISVFDNPLQKIGHWCRKQNFRNCVLLRLSHTFLQPQFIVRSFSHTHTATLISSHHFPIPEMWRGAPCECRGREL